MLLSPIGVSYLMVRRGNSAPLRSRYGFNTMEKRKAARSFGIPIIGMCCSPERSDFKEIGIIGAGNVGAPAQCHGLSWKLSLSM
jgi:2-hydroxychromene-2-carboxylate isomerase